LCASQSLLEHCGSDSAGGAPVAGVRGSDIAEVDGQPGGHMFLCLVEKVPSPFPGSVALGYVTNFYVAPQLRNRGVGRALLDGVNRYARGPGLDTLIVWPSERSAPLYRRCGYSRPEELLERPIAPS
jgi:GNAT superfamily N-acetyltransferase